MGYTIAIAGKGGVGKTTVAALLVARMIARGCKPVLAVDADPNTCLDMALGAPVTSTIGLAREEAREIASKGLAAGVAKQDLLELKISECLVETDDFDLLAMGRSEGPGCYCYANNVLSAAIKRLSGSYPYIVIDNEAGLENLSRRIIQKVDLLLLVSDPSMRGLKTAARIHKLATEMKIEYGRLGLIVNRTRIPGSSAAIETGRELEADTTTILPDNQEIAEWDEQGTSLRLLPETNPVVAEIDRLLCAVMPQTCEAGVG